MSDMTMIDWRETLTAEILVLRIIGRIVYTCPNDEERTWLQSLFDDGVFTETPFSGDNDESQTGLQLLQKWGENGLTDDLFEQMQADYNHLFIGPGRVMAPPWESVYYSEERLIFQRQTLEVRDWYKRFGLEVEKLYHEPDDHIGLELSFLAYLAQLGLQALEQQDDKAFSRLMKDQEVFLSEHLLRWTPTWCDLVEQHAKTDFYRGIAYMVKGALKETAEIIQSGKLKLTLEGGCK